jgi:hypothetical protein
MFLILFKSDGIWTVDPVNFPAARDFFPRLLVWEPCDVASHLHAAQIAAMVSLDYAEVLRKV